MRTDARTDGLTGDGATRADGQGDAGGTGGTRTGRGTVTGARSGTDADGPGPGRADAGGTDTDRTALEDTAPEDTGVGSRGRADDGDRAGADDRADSGARSRAGGRSGAGRRGMARSRGWWRGKSTPQQVETYTRLSFHFFAVIEIVSFGVPVAHLLPRWPAVVLALLLVLHGAACSAVSVPALDFVRGKRDRPVRPLVAHGALTAALALGVLAVGRHAPGGADIERGAHSVYWGVLAFGVGALSLALRDTRRVTALVVGAAGFAGAAALLVGTSAGRALVSLLVVLIGGGFLAFTSVFSVWLLNAVYALDEARETRTRLAVAEERLRFARDLHDVLGRNLAVIALKSELAVQLARRGRPEAEAQMVEVQRIAQESQREVRDVVRAYRAADLSAELAGARGVLTAAGIRCSVSGDAAGDAAGLPADVQSTLGWVVREATTNVLRHGNAQRCAIALHRRDGRIVLTVENDGADPAPVTGSGAGGSGGPGSGGSGLAGLRERLAAVDGTLEAGPAGAGIFRLVAEAPLREGPREAKAAPRHGPPAWD